MVEARTIVASRRMILWHTLTAAVGLTASCLLLAASAIWPSNSVKAAVGALGGAVVCSGALIACLMRLAKPYRLSLTPAALVVERSFAQPRHIAWNTVESFFAQDAGNGVAIGFRYVRELGLASLTSGSDSFGKDEALPVGEFTMSATQLVDLLNQARSEGVQPSGLDAADQALIR